MSLKVKDVSSREFKHFLNECIRNGDFAYDDVKDLPVFEFIRFLEKKVASKWKTVQAWLKQNERTTRTPRHH